LKLVDEWVFIKLFKILYISIILLNNWITDLSNNIFVYCMLFVASTQNQCFDKIVTLA